MSKYVLIKKDKSKQQIDASCYTEALKKALEVFGGLLEVEDKEHVVIITPESPLHPIKEEPKIEKKEEAPQKHSFTGKAGEMFELLKKDVYTMEELAQKLGISLSTVKTNLWLFKSKGHLVYTHAMPGKGMVYEVK